MMHMTVDITRAPQFALFAQAMAAKRRNFYETAMKMVVQDIIKGIQERKDIAGARFPPLSPVTIELKGHDQPLVFRGLLSQEYTYEQVNQWRLDRGEITIKPLTAAVEKGRRGSPRDTPRDEVGYKLQIEGVPSRQGHKYFRFFGISREAEEEVTALIDQVVTEALRQI
jgi:hypothetical protein